MEKIGFIGAGHMGRGIAINLAKAGYPVTVHKRRIDDADPVVAELRRQGLSITNVLSDLFGTTEILMTCLPSSVEVEEVVLGEGGLNASRDTTVAFVVDFSTAKPDSTKRISAELARKGIRMLDTPMTGGPQQAAEGTINLAVGGEERDLVRLRPVLEAVAGNIIYAGPSGSGNVLKLLNNFLGLTNRCVGSAVCIAAERFGVSKQVLLDFILLSGGYSRGFESQMKMIMKGDFSPRFALKLGLKDLRYALELFQLEQINFPPAEELVSLMQRAAESGFESYDVGSVYEYLRDAQPEQSVANG